MPLKFAANISTMFKEGERLINRYALAESVGFKSVECQFPYDFKEDDLQRVKTEANINQILINSYPGTGAQFGFGLSSSESFNKSIEITLGYAEALNCKKVHIISELKKENLSDIEMEDIFVKNLQHAVDLFAKKDIMCLLEPICSQVKANYFMDSFEKAVRCIKRVNSPNLKLLMDVFHLQMLSGNLTNNIKSYFPYTGYVQVSQAPNRNEINAPGEIKYDYILRLLEKLGYDGYVGLEYFPSGSTTDSLKWMKEYGYNEKNL